MRHKPKVQCVRNASLNRLRPPPHPPADLLQSLHLVIVFTLILQLTLYHHHFPLHESQTHPYCRLLELLPDFTDSNFSSTKRDSSYNRIMHYICNTVYEKMKTYLNILIHCRYARVFLLFDRCCLWLCHATLLS